MSVVVRRVGDGQRLEFDVVVREGRGETRHAVTVARDTLARLVGDTGASPEQLVRAVFAFLLDREPKESILARFDVTVVRRYFPEFDGTIGAYLGK